MAEVLAADGGTPDYLCHVDTRINAGEFKVTFYTGYEGEGVTVAAQYLDDGEKAFRPADPVREGYVFKYWYKGLASLAYNFDNAVRESFTLNAHWEPV